MTMKKQDRSQRSADGLCIMKGLDMTDKLKFGIIGTNFISHTMAEAMELSGTAELYSVYSRRRETGESFAERYGIPRKRVYTSPEELAGSGIDAVYIASPNKFHCEQSLFFLRRGIHVLVEKPAGAELAEYELMRRTAEENGVVLMEGMRQAHDPAWQIIREALPRIGRVRHASFEFCQYSSRYDRHKAGEHTNTFDPSFANASMLDLGVYPLHCLVMLFGEPRVVSANSVFLENGFECLGEITLAYDGFTASALYSKVYDSPRPSAVFGEAGTIIIDKLSVPSSATLFLRNAEPESLPVVGAENNMVYEVRDFVRLVRDGRILHHYADMTEAVIRITDKARSLAGVRFE